MEQVKREFYCLFDHFVMDENPTRALAPVKINHLSQQKMCKNQKCFISVVYSTIYTLLVKSTTQVDYMTTPECFLSCINIQQPPIHTT